MYAAPGTFAAVSETNTWRLVGDTANGGIGVPKSRIPPATDYKGGTPGFDVTLYKASGTVSSITHAEAMIASAAIFQSYATQEVAPYINYLGSGGNTVNGRIFPVRTRHAVQHGQPRLARAELDGYEYRQLRASGLGDVDRAPDLFELKAGAQDLDAKVVLLVDHDRGGLIAADDHRRRRVLRCSIRG